MRIYYLLFFLFFIATAAKSQIPNNTTAPEDAAFNTMYSNRAVPKVTGKLLNLAPGEWKTLPVTYTLITPFSEFESKKTVTVQPDGSFRFDLDYGFPYQQVWFSAGELFHTGLLVNKDIYLELDMKKIRATKKVSFNGDGVRYLGTDGPMNIYLNNFILYKRPEQLKLSASISAMFGPPQGDIGKDLARYNNLFDSLKNIEDSFISLNPSPFGWILANERMSDYYTQIFMKYDNKPIEDSLWQKINSHKSYMVSSNSAGFYNNIVMYVARLPRSSIPATWKDVEMLPYLDASEKTVIDSLRETEKMQRAYSSTKENIQQWTRKLEPRIRQINFIRSLDNSIHKLDSLFAPSKADFLKLRLYISTELADQRIALQHILPSIHTNWCIAVVKNEVRRASEKIDAINKELARSAGGASLNGFGKPVVETSFGASLYKAPSIKAADFLEKLKQAFPGKAIIIDRWATWCIPCLSEMPHSKALQQSAKDLPVVFVYLCTVWGSSESNWKTKVLEIQQPGVHFLIDEGLDRGLSSYFSFNGYPGYALINKDGAYKPGAITWMQEINDREALVGLINR